MYLRVNCYHVWSVGNVAAHRRRQHAVTVGKERRESLVRAKRLCRVGTSGQDDTPLDSGMIIDENQSILEVQTSSAVEGLKSAVAYQYVTPGLYEITGKNLFLTID